MLALRVNSGTARHRSIVVGNKPAKPLISLRPARAGSVAFTGGAAAPRETATLIARYTWLGEVRERRAKPHDGENVRSPKNCRNEIRSLSFDFPPKKWTGLSCF
jgi:hypothetical protein